MRSISLKYFRLMPAILLLLSFLVSCSDLLPFGEDDEVLTPEKILPGIWHDTEVSFTTGQYIVTNPSTGMRMQIETPAYQIAVNKQSDYYTVLKFNNSEIIPLSGSKFLDAQLIKSYPYTITQDSVITSNLFKPRYSQSFCYIKNLKKNSFDLVVDEMGDPLYDSNIDTVCVKETKVYSFSRLR